MIKFYCNLTYLLILYKMVYIFDIQLLIFSIFGNKY